MVESAHQLLKLSFVTGLEVGALGLTIETTVEGAAPAAATPLLEGKGLQASV